MVWPRECIFRCFYRSAATLQLCCAIPMGLKTAKITKRRWSWNSKTQALPITFAQSKHVAKWKLKNRYLGSGQTAARFSSFYTRRTDRHIELDPAFLFHWFHWEFLGVKAECAVLSKSAGHVKQKEKTGPLLCLAMNWESHWIGVSGEAISI